MTRSSVRSSALTSVLLVGALALVPAAAVAGPLAGPALAATTTDPAKVGLYGSQDPTFDGVYRQSLALLAVVADGATPPPSAVSWLLAQQCGDGGFEAFRATLTAACTAPSSTSFSGEDSNSTGLAVQALHALGKDADAGRGADWLVAHQAADGGWPYYPDGAAGNASDANSTALGLSALLSLGRTPPKAGGTGPTPYDVLLALQVGCPGAVDERGAFTFFGSANDYATVQATLAVDGGFLPVPHATGSDDAPVLTCPAAKSTAVRAHGIPGATPAQSAGYAAGYLARRLAANGHAIPDAFTAGAVDYGSTANAVIALVATRHGASEATAALGVLAGSQAAFTTKSGADLPGALATLSLAAVAGGQDPASFAGSDLMTRLAATLTTAAATPTPTPTKTSASAAPTTSSSVAAAGAGADPTLAATGPDTRAGAALGGGLALLVLGAALVALSRRALTTGRHGGARR